MTSSDDPFEVAARREHAAVQNLAGGRAGNAGGWGGNAGGWGGSAIWQSGRSGKGMLTTVMVFLGPYLLWAGLRAGSHAWATPSVGESVVNFFFGTGVPFALYTAWMLLLLWIWAINAAGRSGRGMLTTVIVFLGPYLLWAGLRAGSHAWATPSVGESVVNFFFGTGVPFALYTAWMLLLLWIWAINAAVHRGAGAR